MMSYLNPYEQDEIINELLTVSTKNSVLSHQTLELLILQSVFKNFGILSVGTKALSTTYLSISNAQEIIITPLLKGWAELAKCFCSHSNLWKLITALQFFRPLIWSSVFYDWIFWRSLTWRHHVAAFFSTSADFVETFLRESGVFAERR